jgi:hypothetical protein
MCLRKGETTARTRDLEVTSTSMKTATCTESNLHMCLRKKETRVRTRELEVTSPSMNMVKSAASNLQKSLRNIETRARTRVREVTSIESNLDMCLREGRDHSKDKGAGGHFFVHEYGK